MKQRTRIRRLKDRLYPWWIYASRRRRHWAEALRTYRSMRDAMREAYGSVA